MQRKLSFGLFAFLFILTSSVPGLAFDHGHSEWSILLKKYVATDGGKSWVSYSRWKNTSEDIDLLKKYTNEIQNVKQSDYNQWSRNQKMSFLINAYNSLTVQLILDNYPVKSIKDLGSFLASPWKKSFFQLLEQKSHLDKIEHEMLRKQFDEPRIHFALVCASKSCPGLRTEAFVDTKLDLQLEDSAKLFLNEKERNRWDRENKKMELSSIFKWFRGDFEKKETLQNFVLRYFNLPEDQKLQLKDAKIEFLEYDWSLNER